MRQRGIAKVVVILLLGLVVLGAGAGVALLYGRGQLEAPSTTHGNAIAVRVTADETVDQLAQDLETRGLIRSHFWFSAFARFRGLGSQLHEGTFLVDKGMGASAIIATLEGATETTSIPITFPEGMTAKQMAASASEQFGFPASAYEALVHTPAGFDEPFLAKRPKGASLEGFLFPDTYSLSVNATAHDVIAAQLHAFQLKAVPLLTSTTLTVEQTIIVASIIEREAKDPVDLPLVSGVIANRLAQGMRLQIDATVLYGIGVTGRSPTAAELAQDTPYNSYVHAGLPPTAISNPGVASITAAAVPAHTTALFYISDCDGHNHYSDTEQQHEQAIATYLSKPCGAAS